MPVQNEILTKLAAPFHPSRITWKPGSLRKDGTAALALAYADLRAYQDRLDEICGVDWSCTYTPWGDKIIAHVTVHGVTRSSVGEPTTESERGEIDGTVAEAQAFKRACAMFGLGRYLYSLPSLWVDWDAQKREFTEKAKVRLHGVIAQHYQRYLDTHVVAELDAITAGSAPVVAHRGPEPTGVDAELDGVNVATVEELNPFNDAPATTPTPTPVVDEATRKKLNILNSLGTTFYNKNKNDKAWDNKREELAKFYRVSSSAELTGEQLDKLIVGLEDQTRRKLTDMGGVPAEVVQECTAYGNYKGATDIEAAKGVGLAKCLQWAKVNKAKVAA